VPRVRYRFRPSWYTNSVSQEVGKRAGVTTDPERFSNVWKLKGDDFAPSKHPRVQRELVSKKSLTLGNVMSEIELRAQNPRIAKIMDAPRGVGNATPAARASSPKIRRREMFNDAATKTAERHALATNSGTKTLDDLRRARQTPDAKRMRNTLRAYDVAADSQFPRSPEAIWRKQYHNVKPAQTLPYKPATAKSGRVPTPPRPSSGVSPRIAGMGAAAILKGTGALSALPAVVHLARGKSLGSMAGPIPPHILPKKVQRSIRRAESVRGVW
jgi:hypothetical protein